MNFFNRQAKAIKQTRILVSLFLLAIVLITLAINAVFYFALASQTTMAGSLNEWLAQGYWIYISLGTIAIILLTSLFRSWQINSNPGAIIQMVDATRIPFETKDFKQRQLVNLVEEMAIASGMPIPSIYVMKNEQGLNAFVSGLKPSAAILVVTQGLLDQLDRQQLQGVIGHEFSHILNGDMRLNLRLMGVVAGILVLGQIGQVILRGGFRGGRHNRHSYSRGISLGSSSSGKKNSGAAAILLVGVGLFVVGYIGLFCGRLIKAAISRQREFLADASAVQFTRDRNGIAGALLSIKNATQGSMLNSEKAEEMSHMCFGASTKISQKFSGWLASHPPLDDRIQAIYPGFLRFQSSQKQSKKSATKNTDFSNSASESIAQFSATNTTTNAPPNDQVFSEFEREKPALKSAHSNIAYQLSKNIGKTTPEHLNKAERLLRQLPKNLLEIARGESPDAGPLHLILTLFTIANGIETTELEKRVSQYLTGDENSKILLIKNQLEKLNFTSRHALFDLALARIEDLNLLHKQQLFEQIKKLIKTSKNLTPSGLAIYAAIANKVRPVKPYQKQINRYKNVADALNILFHQLLKDNQYDNTNWTNAEQHQQTILKSFGVKVTSHKFEFDAKDFHQSLNQLARLNPLLKEELILSVTDAIQVDDKIEENELDFLRLLCEYLDCPIPLD